MQHSKMLMYSNPNQEYIVNIQNWNIKLQSPETHLLQIPHSQSKLKLKTVEFSNVTELLNNNITGFLQPFVSFPCHSGW